MIPWQLRTDCRSEINWSSPQKTALPYLFRLQACSGPQGELRKSSLPQRQLSIGLKTRFFLIMRPVKNYRRTAVSISSPSIQKTRKTWMLSRIRCRKSWAAKQISVLQTLFTGRCLLPWNRSAVLAKLMLILTLSAGTIIVSSAALYVDENKAQRKWPSF